MAHTIQTLQQALANAERNWNTRMTELTGRLDEIIQRFEVISQAWSQQEQKFQAINEAWKAQEAKYALMEETEIVTRAGLEEVRDNAD